MSSACLMTVLTTDLRNFTHHSNHRDNESAEDFQTRFQVLCNIVRDFHAQTITIARAQDPGKEATVLSTGDGLIIGFQTDDHAVAACRTAMELRANYVGFFQEAGRQMGENRRSYALDYGIGIHTGMVEVRQYPSYHVPNAVETMLLGDALNISTRLESLTKDHPGCDIMLSEDSARRLVESLGPTMKDRLIDYQIHSIRGYRPLRVFGIAQD